MFCIGRVLTLSFAVFLFISSSAAYLKEKPGYIDTCKIADPDAAKCLTDTTQKFVEHLNTEFPQAFEKYGQFDPFHIDKIIFDDGQNAGATLKVNLTDVSVFGFGKTVVKEMKINKKDFSTKAKLLVPEVKVDGKYQMDGKLSVLPIKGNGKIALTMENLELRIIAKGKFYEQDGLIFAKIVSVKTSFTLTGLKSKLDNLFDGKSPDIEKTTNDFFNESWPEFLEALRPLFDKTFDDLHFDVLSNIFSLVPVNYFIADMPPLKDLPQV